MMTHSLAWNRKWALCGSMLLNIALLAWALARHVTIPKPTLGAIEANRVVPPALFDNARPDNHRPPPKKAGQRPAKPVDWRQVESSDYQVYIENLRTIGCPEKTIREIITADVNDLFASRRATITETNQFQFWRATPLKLSDEQNHRLHELAVERTEVLRTLGVESSDWLDILSEYFRPQFENKEFELAFLSEAKRQSLKDLLFQAAQSQIGAPENSPDSDKVEAQTQSSVRELLSAEEFHEYQLRTSIPSAQLREVLKDMEPNEMEFRTIFDTWNELNAHTPGSSEYRDSQQVGETTLSNLLGQSRFALYLQAVKSLGYSQLRP